jgi:hypothetical protein
MARKGRPRKANGKRHPNGKLVQKPKAKDPTAKVTEARKRFGSYYASALGRFYASGFMGEGDVAKDRYEGALRFLRVYAAVYGGPYYRCPLDQSVRGRGAEYNNPYAKEDREWMREMMQKLEWSGCYPYLEQLLSISYIDEGPEWLSRMLDVQLWNRELAELNAQLRAKAKVEGKMFSPLWPKDIHPGDRVVADAAIKALDVLSPERRVVGIVAMRWDDAA